MKRIIAFTVGLLIVPIGFTLFILGLIPLAGLGMTIAALLAAKMLYGWMVGEKPVAILTPSGMLNPSEDALADYKYRVLEVRLSFAAGAFTSYFLFTIANANPNGTWLVMALIFLPVYVITTVLIAIALFEINKITNEPVWLPENKSAGQGHKVPVVVLVATVATLLALISIPVITIGVNANHTQRAANERREKEHQALLQEREGESRELSSAWTEVSLESSPKVSFYYPSHWGTPSVQVTVSPPGYVPSGTFRTSFSNPKTPVLLLYYGVTDTTGLKPIKNIENVEVTAKNSVAGFYFDKANLPDWCSIENDCNGGQYAADMREILRNLSASAKE